MSKIIVYLDDYQYNSDNKYDSIFLDFRTLEDYGRFLENTRLSVEYDRGSFIEIKNYQSQKRLIRGAYYSLNMELLKELDPIPHPESLLIAQTYDFEQFERRNKEGIFERRNEGIFHLLESHTPLDPTELYATYHNRIENIEALKSFQNMSFRVNNVGQANWNEILYDDNVKVVFDIGAPIYANVTQVQNYIDSYASHYAASKPYLILSHWDKDHYHCLLKMNDREINHFSKFICVDNMKSNTSKQLFERIESILGRDRVFCIPSPSRQIGSAYSNMHLNYTNENISIYVGENSRNINYCGIIVYAQGNKGNVICSGDCIPAQANQVIQNEWTTRYNNVKQHFLVVPHHGGDFKRNAVYKTYNIPSGYNPKSAIISVDEMNNSYGHPDGNMLNWLQSIAPWNIERTDKNGSIVKTI